ncbi:MAG TPA: hypothetical protein VHL31_10105 [Geminicoccus sp.]|jgi:hypothetical protein|uniref:hypothetical protein n=1 Tax=Geminicoccus sp. TaxID=2024832 RepID=UPI002E32A85A|nr:hypothetical protein [Geminicoccus sp.]HEX2526633.1 hypothetical protein [Geminicoccus sp.]
MMGAKEALHGEAQGAANPDAILVTGDRRRWITRTTGQGFQLLVAQVLVRLAAQMRLHLIHVDVIAMAPGDIDD